MEYYSITNLHTLVVRKHFQLKLLSIFSDLQYTFHNFVYSAILPDCFMSVIIKATQRENLFPHVIVK